MKRNIMYTFLLVPVLLYAMDKEDGSELCEKAITRKNSGLVLYAQVEVMSSQETSSRAEDDSEDRVIVRRLSFSERRRKRNLLDVSTKIGEALPEVPFGKETHPSDKTRNYYSNLDNTSKGFRRAKSLKTLF